MERVLTPEAEAFLREWENPKPYITAHTSGSTGAPKEIRLLKADMLASARATVARFGLTASSRLHLPLSPGYIAGKMQIIRALTADCALTVEPPTAAPLAEGDSRPITLVPIVPAQISGLLASPRLGLIENVIIGGAPISPEAERALLDAGVNAFATYGMTETCSHVALRAIGCPHFDALPGFEFGVDARGCLVIDSTTLSFGRLVTNDVVRLLSPTRFEWLGRADFAINSGGMKLHPEQMERIIAPYLPKGETFYITSAPSARWGEEAVIVTTSEKITDCVLERIKRDSDVPHTQIPKRVVRVEEMKFTDSGKLIREKISTEEQKN